MCLTVPGRVTQIQGAMAEVETERRREWYNALAQPDVQVGDFVLTHANLIVAIISREEAQHIQEAVDEVERRLEEEQAAEEPQSTESPGESGTQVNGEYVARFPLEHRSASTRSESAP